MFRDLKEYQEIYNLYQNSVYLSEEQREFVEAINEAELTDEELYYFSENTDEVIDYLIETEVLNEKIKGLFKLGGLVKGLAKTKLPTKGVTLSSIGGFKGFKGSGGLKGISTKLTNPLKKFQSPNLKGLLKGKKDKISKSTGINKEILSIKGKSNEGLGFIGRKEGIAVFSNTTIKITDE